MLDYVIPFGVDLSAREKIFEICVFLCPFFYMRDTREGWVFVIGGKISDSFLLFCCLMAGHLGLTDV